MALQHKQLKPLSDNRPRREVRRHRRPQPLPPIRPAGFEHISSVLRRVLVTLYRSRRP